MSFMSFLKAVLEYFNRALKEAGMLEGEKDEDEIFDIVPMIDMEEEEPD